MMDIYTQIGVACACVLGFSFILIFYGYYKQYKKSTGGKPITFTYLVALLLFLSVLPIVIPLLIIFAICCQFVGIILRIRFGSNFGGLLQGPDAVHALDVEDDSKNVGNVLFVIQCPIASKQNDNFYENFKNSILKKFAENVVKTPKLWYTWKTFMGYSYYIKNQITPEDCISKLEAIDVKNRNEITKEECVELVTKFANAALPKNHSALWEVKIGSQPIKWKSGNADEYKYYPVVLRIHHCLSDAASFVKTFIKIFADKAVEIPLPKKYDTFKPAVNGQIGVKLPTTKEVKITSKPFVYLWKTLGILLNGIYILIMVPCILLVQNLIKANDNNILHGPALSGKKTLTIAIEELPHYIKGIKSRFPGTTLPEVLFAAISYSFHEYFKKYSTSMPDTIASLVPVFPESSNLIEFFPDNHSIKKVICRNKFSLAVFNLPITVDEEPGDKRNDVITKRLALIKEQINIFKHSIDYQVNYLVLMVFVGILPFTLRKIFSELLRCTFLISIVPAAPSAMTILGGYLVKDVLFWVPHRGPIGIGFSVFSYDGRLQIGLTTDDTLISEEPDAQMILDGIYKYLDLLNIETDYSRV